MSRLKDALLFITFAIPKAGAKIGGFPLYISLLSSMYFMFMGVLHALARPKELLLALIPLILLLLSFLINQSSYNALFFSGSPFLPLSSQIAYISSMFAFFCYYGALGINNADNWKRYLKVIFYILVIYALMQKIIGDYTVVIPGITANFQDAVTPNFLADKNNMIWGIHYLKATSTYQNGNVFGANLLLIGFAVIANLRNELKGTIVPLALLGIVVLLTASASIYLGMIGALLWMFFTAEKKSPMALIIMLLVIVASVVMFLILLNTDNIFSKIIYERLVNRDLSQGSGRIEKIIYYIDIITEHPLILLNGMLSYNRTFYEIYEVLPASIAQIFGVPMMLYFLSFIFLKLKPLLRSPYILPFVAYFCASLSDGAFWLPPTATNLFILMGLCTVWFNQECKNKTEGAND